MVWTVSRKSYIFAYAEFLNQRLQMVTHRLSGPGIQSHDVQAHPYPGTQTRQRESFHQIGNTLVLRENRTDSRDCKLRADVRRARTRIKAGDIHGDGKHRLP